MGDQKRNNNKTKFIGVDIFKSTTEQEIEYNVAKIIAKYINNKST